MRHWVLVLMSMGAVGFNDLSATEQKRVFDHCNTDQRIERIVEVCYEDLFPHKCWMPYFEMCLDTWR